MIARDLRQMLPLGEARPWRVPVVMTVAERGDGVEQLDEAIAAHLAHLEAGGELERRVAGGPPARSRRSRSTA